MDLITDEEWKLLKDNISEEKNSIQDRKNNGDKCKNKKIIKKRKLENIFIN